MINFRRKIGIILVVAVSAAAIMAVPASAAPKKVQEFDYNCQGTVPLDVRMSEEQPSTSDYSCTIEFTLKASRDVWIESFPGDTFTGPLRVELFRVSGTSEYFQFGFLNYFVAGQTAAESVAYPTLSPGTYRVRATAENVTINPHWYFADAPESYSNIPASTGVFGARAVVFNGN